MYSELLGTYHSWRWTIWISLYVEKTSYKSQLTFFQYLECHFLGRSGHLLLPDISDAGSWKAS